MTEADHPAVAGSVLFTDLVGFTEYNDAVGDVERCSTTVTTPGWSRRSAMV